MVDRVCGLCSMNENGAPKEGPFWVLICNIVVSILAAVITERFGLSFSFLWILCLRKLSIEQRVGG